MAIRNIRIALLILSILLVWFGYYMLFERQPLLDFKGSLLLASAIATVICNAGLLQLKSLSRPLLAVILLINVLYVVAARLDFYRWDIEGQAFLSIPLHLLVDAYVILAAILVMLLWNRKTTT